MSASISFCDDEIPNASVTFSGIQDVQEAEIQRDEERHHKEMNSFLALEMEHEVELIHEDLLSDTYQTDDEEDEEDDEEEEDADADIVQYKRETDHSGFALEQPLYSSGFKGHITSHSLPEGCGRSDQKIQEGSFAPELSRKSAQILDSQRCQPTSVSTTNQNNVTNTNNFQVATSDNDWMMQVQKSSLATHQLPVYAGTGDQYWYHHQLLVPPSLTSSTPAALILPVRSSNDDRSDTLYPLRNDQLSGNTETTDEWSRRYKVQYQKPHLETLAEAEFFLENESVKFFDKDGAEEQRRVEQLEILYRASGRKIEELTHEMEEKEEEKNKEIRSLKHKLAIANAEAEAKDVKLRECQEAVEKTKSENISTGGKIRALETQVSSLTDTREELIKKLQTAESTIENLTHQIEELRASESLSRARNEYEAFVNSLKDRHERELLALREQLDVSRAALDVKQEEMNNVSKQLADIKHEYEEAQMSRAKVINSLSQSLEESQRQCQTLLEKSSSHEISVLRVKLQQSMASTKLSEEFCQTLQAEVKELKEQLSMYESASSLGLFSVSSHAAPVHDDSMADLGIRKTLNFDTPHSAVSVRSGEVLASIDQVQCLKSELERCLRSNKDKRAEIAEKRNKIKSMQEELLEAQNKVAGLEKVCSEQRKRLLEIESLTSSSDGVGIVEARLRRDIENLKREKEVLLADIEDYKSRLHETADSERKLTEINAELSHQISQVMSDCDLDRQTALENCQRNMEEVSRIARENLRQEMAKHHQTEKAQLEEQYQTLTNNLKEKLKCALAELDAVKSQYVKTCEENTCRETELNNKLRQLQQDLMQMSQSRQAQVRQPTADDLVTDSAKLWLSEKERDLQKWLDERNVYESKLAKQDTEIAELREKLEKISRESRDQVQAQSDDTEMRLMSQEKHHMEEVKNLLNKYDEEKLQVEHKLNAMYKQFSLATEKTVVPTIESISQENDLLRKLNILESVIADKELKLKEVFQKLEKQAELNREVQESRLAQTQGRNDDDNSESCSNRVRELEVQLINVKLKYEADISDLKHQHSKEFDSAARVREEKFQAELQYFLKQREARYREELEKAIRECETKAKLELQKAVNEVNDIHKLEMQKVICECKEKGSSEVKMISEEYEAKLKREIRSVEVEALTEVIIKHKQEIEEIRSQLQEKHVLEKSSLEKMIQQLEQEIVNLSVRQEEEERKLKEEYEKKMEKIKTECDKVVADLQQKLAKQTSEAAILKKSVDSLKTESEGERKIAQELRSEVERMKIIVRDAEATAAATETLQAEKAKWFQNAHEYMSQEIKKGVEDKLKEEQEKMKKELEKMKEWETEKVSLEKTIQEKVEKEVLVARQEMERQKEADVERKVGLEIENLKKIFHSAVEVKVLKEKSVWEEEMKKTLKEENDKYMKMLEQDLERRFGEDKLRMEDEIKQEKENEMREMREEMKEEMRKRIQKERQDLERERDETECDNVVDNGKIIGWRERLQSEVEARTKACKERDMAVEVLRSQEVRFVEEKQRLTLGLQKCREDLETMKHEHAVLEEKCVEIDKKYKTDMKKARQKREQDLTQLKAKLEQEKDSLVSFFTAQVADIQAKFQAAVDKKKKEGEREKSGFLPEDAESSSSIILELRDQYLETVAKIKADAVAHVQDANVKAAAAMEAEIHKQKLKVIELIQRKVKANMKSILSKTVSETLISALEHSVDLLCGHLISTSSAGSNTPRCSRNDREADNSRKHSQNSAEAHTTVDAPVENDKSRDPGMAAAWRVGKGVLERVLPSELSPRNDLQSSRARENAKFEHIHVDSQDKGEKDVHERQTQLVTQVIHEWHPQEHKQPHPQLEKVELFETHQCSSSSSNASSPASARHVKTLVKSVPREHHMTMPATVRPTPLSALKSSASKSKSEPAADSTARNDLKVFEAKLLLENWAKSGEMPWKPSSEKSNITNSDAEGFHKPESDSERRLRNQKEKSDIRQPISSSGDSCQKHKDNYRHNVLSVTESHDNVSTGTNVSFHTLEPDSYVSLREGHPQSGLRSVIFPNKGENLHAKRRELSSQKLEQSESSSECSDCYPDFPPLSRGIIVAPGKRELQGGSEAGSQESISSSGDERCGQGHGQEIPVIPTSTPLTRLHRTNTEASVSRSKQWKCLREDVFSPYLNKQCSLDQEPEKYPRSVYGVRAPHSDFLPKKSSRSQSVDKTGSRDLVLKSAEFPSHLSRITDGSSFEQPNLWRYKSLEELIPDLRKQDEVKRGKLAPRHDSTDDIRLRLQKDMAPRERASNQTRADFMTKPRHSRAPVQAMTSEFWELQSNAEQAEQVPQSQCVSSFSETTHHNLLSTFPERRESTRDEAVESHGKSGHVRPSRHKTAHKKKRSQGEYNKGLDPRPWETDGPNLHAHPHSGSRSEPRPGRAQAYHKEQQLPGEEQVPARYVYDDNMSKGSYDRAERSRQPPSPAVTSSDLFLKEVLDLRRSLEELQPPHHHHHHSSAKTSAGLSGMVRSSSEQALHTKNYEVNHSQNKGQACDDHIDVLVSAYTASQPQFDLHHFLHEEQF